MSTMNTAGIFERHREALVDQVQALGNLDLRDTMLTMVYVAVKSPEWAWHMVYAMRRLAIYMRERPGEDQEIWSAIYRETSEILDDYREVETP
jgi:hypothetical protein